MDANRPLGRQTVAVFLFLLLLHRPVTRQDRVPAPSFFLSSIPGRIVHNPASATRGHAFFFTKRCLGCIDHFTEIWNKTWARLACFPFVGRDIAFGLLYPRAVCLWNSPLCTISHLFLFVSSSLGKPSCAEALAGPIEGLSSFGRRGLAP
ncbi:hypothetical protein BT67DRAFT_53291 [Trichocladium antarcticum]|uniref:Secreted protein n=1 Tax=Trichocladium antarcticum TaxID=1450529 RepID=A0AAN6ZD84_9PEZI|nr:hypothetical protein BT67DRAFT_53291 [Trichocladium antarcticum]